MTPAESESPSTALAVRGFLGGLLMGLANLVPGISGGTMLLASGVYTEFVGAVAEVTTFRFRLRAVLILAVIGGTAILAIVLLAGPVRFLVMEYRWVMYSIFVGLTLGGVPIVWRLARPPSLAVAVGAALGFATMALLAFTNATSDVQSGYVILAVAGMAGASAMILPGVSGAYLLLVLGQYETILGAVDQCKKGLGGNFDLILDALHVVIPVGLGMLVGIVGISNLVRWALHRYAKLTLGILLGLLFGSVLGIWPFQEAAKLGHSRVYFTPGLFQVAAAAGLIAAGFGITLLIDRVGRDSPGGPP